MKGVMGNCESVEVSAAIGEAHRELLTKLIYEAKQDRRTIRGIAMPPLAFLSFSASFWERQRFPDHVPGDPDQASFMGYPIFVAPGMCSQILYAPGEAGRLAYENTKQLQREREG